MSTGSNRQYGKKYGTLIVMGILSASLYGLLFWKEGFVNFYFPRGGVFAILPIGTALIFSLVHGTFTSRFWSAIGIEAAPKKSEEK